MLDYPIEQAREAKYSHQQVRAVWLMKVREEEITPLEVITAAKKVTSLRKIRVYQLLLAQQGWGPSRARKLISLYLKRLDHQRIKPTEVTIGWIIDTRTHGKRLEQWIDTTTPLPQILKLIPQWPNTM